MFLSRTPIPWHTVMTVVKAVIMFGREMQPHAFLLLLWLKKKILVSSLFQNFTFLFLFFDKEETQSCDGK